MREPASQFGVPAGIGQVTFDDMVKSQIRLGSSQVQGRCIIVQTQKPLYSSAGAAVAQFFQVLCSCTSAESINELPLIYVCLF